MNREKKKTKKKQFTEIRGYCFVSFGIRIGVQDGVGSVWRQIDMLDTQKRALHACLSFRPLLGSIRVSHIQTEILVSKSIWWFCTELFTQWINHVRPTRTNHVKCALHQILFKKLDSCKIIDHSVALLAAIHWTGSRKCCGDWESDLL